MDPALAGAELEQLLAALLRMLSPAAVPPDSRPGVIDHAGSRAPASPASSGSAPDGSAPDGSAPDGSATSGGTPGGAVLSGGAPDGSAPGGKASGDSTPSGGAPTGFPAVTASEARALTELLAAHGIAQGQLAALLGLEKSTVSRLAAGL